MDSEEVDRRMRSSVTDLKHIVDDIGEQLWQAETADDAADPLARLTRATTRAWSATNPDGGGDFFYPVSWMTQAHFGTMVARGAETAAPADLRTALVAVALAWQDRYGVAPAITSAISELDAALLVGAVEDDLLDEARSQVTAGHDFVHDGLRYQVKANRTSGRKGSAVTLVGKAANLDWDRLIWVLYDRTYLVQEAWMWHVEDYARDISPLKRVSPVHMRAGIDLLRRTSQPEVRR